MNGSILATATAALDGIEREGLTKHERSILSPQGSHIAVEGMRPGGEIINLCANNYLGLADHPRLVAARAGGARRATASACRRSASSAAPQTLHKRARGSGWPRFLGTDDAILYSLLLRRQWRAVRDAARRGGRDHLRRAQPRLASSTASGSARPSASATPTTTWPTSRRSSRRRGGRRFRLIATDGVFSMDGIIANLPAICDLAERYDALVMVDDCHAVGFLGPNGRGTPEHCGVAGPRRHHHRHARQGAGRRHRRLHRRPARRSSSCSASGRGPICSPTRSRRRSPPPRSQVLDLLEADRRRCARSSHDNARALPRRHGSGSASTSCRASTRSFRSCSATPRSRSEMADAPARARRLRHRLLLPGGAAGQGAHPHADVGGALAGADLDRRHRRLRRRSGASWEC